MTTTSYSLNGTTVNTGDRISLEGELFTITRIVGRWVTLSNGSNISRADAADARAEYLEDEECLGEEIEDTEFDDEIDTEEEAAEGEAEEGEAEEESHDIVDPKYREVYTKTVSANGNRTYDRDDDLAQILRACTIEQILSLCYTLLPAKAGRWDHLNVGQRSMNARNAIRHGMKSLVLDRDQVLDTARAICTK